MLEARVVFLFVVVNNLSGHCGREGSSETVEAERFG